MRRLIRLAVFLVLAWGVGLLAYVGTLYFVWNQTLGSELYFVVIWSALALLIAFPLIYIPGLIGLHCTLGAQQGMRRTPCRVPLMPSDSLTDR